jgi:hypothetical protein
MAYAGDRGHAFPKKRPFVCASPRALASEMISEALYHLERAVLRRQILLSGASAPDIACGASAPALVYCSAVLGRAPDIILYMYIVVLWRQILLSGASVPDLACGASAPALIYGTAVLRRQILYMCGASAPGFLWVGGG